MIREETLQRFVPLTDRPCPRHANRRNDAQPVPPCCQRPLSNKPSLMPTTFLHRKGMIAWITEGLEKVVPQPDLKSKEPAEPHTEVQQLLQHVIFI